MVRSGWSGNFQPILTRHGITPEQCDRLLEEISIWAESQDSIAAFAECITPEIDRGSRQCNASSRSRRFHPGGARRLDGSVRRVGGHRLEALRTHRF